MYFSFKTLYCYYFRKSSEDWNVRYLMMLKWIGNNHKCNWVMLHLATWTFKVHVEYNVKRIIIKVYLQRELCCRQTQTRIRQTSWDKYFIVRLKYLTSFTLRNRLSKSNRKCFKHLKYRQYENWIIILFMFRSLQYKLDIFFQVRNVQLFVWICIRGNIASM